MDSGGEKASDLCTYTTQEVERVVRAAARLARGRRGKLTSVDKANVLETSRLWRRVTTRIIAEEFPDVRMIGGRTASAGTSWRCVLSGSLERGSVRTRRR